MKKDMVKTYSTTAFVQVGNYFLRKVSIESVDDSVPGKIELITTSGMHYSVKGEDVKPVLIALGFNAR